MIPAQHLTSTRVAWVDIARGIAIILVAMYHAALFLEPLESDGGWLTFMNVLETFRMPVFFFAAGVFSAKILTQSFADLWRRRLALFLYLYALWTVIRFVYFQVCPWVLEGSNPADWRELAGSPVLPAGGLWFLYALALFSVFVWLFRKAPWWIPVGISLAVSVAFGSELITVDSTAWSKTGTYMFFFVVSVYGRNLTLKAADSLRVWMIVVIVAAYGVAGAAFWVVDDLRTVVGLRLVVSVLGVAAGVALSVLLSRWRPASVPLQYLGSHTLPIYLVHYLVTAAVAAAMMTYGITVTGIAALVGVPLLAAGSIAISLLAKRALRRVHGIFDLPVLPRRRAEVAAA